MKTIELNREDVTVTGKFATCYRKYAATTAAINKALPEGLFITEDVWLHEGVVTVRLYESITKPLGFTLEEYQTLTGFGVHQDHGYMHQPLNGVMHMLPENGNWSIIGGADVHNIKHAKIITTVKVEVGKVIIPAI
jgi:hypothetical protein